MSETKFPLKPIEKLDKKTRRLARLALGARRRAYAPYTKYLVGSVIQDGKGKIHSGCNVENAAIGTICAERTAVVKMVSRGMRSFKTVVIAASSEEPCFPCGPCRQMLYEFGPDARVVAVNKRASTFREATMRELLPCGFSGEQLGNR